MKYSTRQYVLPTKGKNAGILLRVVEIEAQVARGPYHLSDDRWYPENELLSIPEFKALQAENERLKAVIADVKRVATGLYERAPTEGVTELLYYLAVMQREFDLALAESEE